MHNVDSYSVKWSLRNDCGLIFAAVYQKLLSPPYVDQLLQLVSTAFVDEFRTKLELASGSQVWQLPLKHPLIPALTKL